MTLSDLSIRRPVICLVTSIIIILVGLLSFGAMPVREYPNVDSPTISVTTTYPGASAEVVESKITEPLEKEVAAIEGIRIVRSTSAEQRSSITIELTSGETSTKRRTTFATGSAACVCRWKSILRG